MKTIVVIGTGLAGYLFAKEYRKSNTTTRLIFITQDDGAFYSKPLLSTALSHYKTPLQLRIQTVDEMRLQLNATIHTHAFVNRIDRENKTVFFNDNKHVGYNQLVLAVGAVKNALPFTNTISVNSLCDYEQFRAAIENKKRVAIIGAGLIGCEFANDLLRSGFEVNVIDKNATPLDGIVPTHVGEAFKEKLSQHHLQWHCNETIRAIEKSADQFHVQLDKKTIHADVVLSAIGINPNIILAQQANLTVNRGIIVNAQLQTSDPDIFAVGDCVEYENQTLLYIAPLMQQTKILAHTIDGADAALSYPIMPIVIKTDCYPIVLVKPWCVDGEWIYEESAEGITARFMSSDNSVKGFVLTGTHVKQRADLMRSIARQ